MSVFSLSVSPMSRANGGINCGLYVCLNAENRITLLLGILWWENNNKLVEWKVLIDSVGIKSAKLKDKFLL